MEKIRKRNFFLSAGTEPPQGTQLSKKDADPVWGQLARSPDALVHTVCTITHSGPAGHEQPRLQGPRFPNWESGHTV